MRLTLRRDLGGYALPTLAKTLIDHTWIDHPFVLLTGPNGSGKSAVLRAVRASMGLRGERAGQLDTPFQPHLDPSTTDDPERLATQVLSPGRGEVPADHVPAVFSLEDLGWRGQQTYLFDSRAASQIANAASFDHDMSYHVSLIAGRGRNVSHGQFVSRTWWEAIEWAAGLHDLPDPWKSAPSPAKAAVRASALAGAEPSTERWLLLDEPETAIDAEALLIGLSVLLSLAEPGTLRVLCASHSLLFAAGLSDHPKIQTVDIGGTWLDTQKIALNVASRIDKVDDVGRDILSKLKAKGPNGDRSRRP